MSDKEGVPRHLRSLGTAITIFAGGVLSLSLASSMAIRSIQSVAESKRKKVALACGVCRGKGFCKCKLCDGNSTIYWSPLHDPIAVNPCVCPTCEGNRSASRIMRSPSSSPDYLKIQRCLNCLGKGYI